MEDRFEIVTHQDLNAEGYQYCYVEVLRDKQTGVMYLFRFANTGGGLTVLVDKDGKPSTSFKVSVK